MSRRSFTPYPALSSQQPHALLIVGVPGRPGPKDVENRTWTTGYTGYLWIHAPQTVRSHADEWPLARELVPGVTPETIVTGAVVGIARLAGCFNDRCEAELSLSRRGQRASDWHEDGCCGWYLTDRRALATPVACPGQQGLFRLDRRTELAARRQLGW